MWTFLGQRSNLCHSSGNARSLTWCTTGELPFFFFHNWTIFPFLIWFPFQNVNIHSHLFTLASWLSPKYSRHLVSSILSYTWIERDFTCDTEQLYLFFISICSLGIILVLHWKCVLLSGIFWDSLSQWMGDFSFKRFNPSQLDHELEGLVYIFTAPSWQWFSAWAAQGNHLGAFKSTILWFTPSHWSQVGPGSQQLWKLPAWCKYAG